nr:hypothetical protein [Oleiagrimonas sp.]
QMTIHGKREGFTLADFRACAQSAMLKRGRDKVILEEVIETVRRWPAFAEQAGLSELQTEQIARAHRLVFKSR